MMPLLKFIRDMDVVQNQCPDGAAQGKSYGNKYEHIGAERRAPFGGVIQHAK
jgi:hypothetical protein